GADLDIAPVHSAVKQCIKSVRKNYNAMMWLNQIKHKDDYTCEHSLRVAMLSIALGAALGLDEASLEELGVAAMLHDVGKIKVPAHILNKEGALNDAEYEEMKRHALYGR
ncbi:MAG: hypothetical protein CUN55_21015, partial [Phototrophicales bacterium]